MRWLGQWEERLEEVIARVGEIPGVLCIENLMELTRLGGSTPDSSVAAFLIPYLANGELRIVAEATPGEIAACDRLLPGLIDRMQIIKLQDFTPDQSRRIVWRAADFLSGNDDVHYGPGAAERTFDLFSRFLPYAAFPGKVVQFMGSLADRAPFEWENEIGLPQVEQGFAETTGLPGHLISGTEGLRHDEVVKTFREKLMGQDDAVHTVTRMLAKFAAGLNDVNRPLGVLLFCGPTGVGKTQLVRMLGDYLFPNRPEKERLIRLDMSEYAGFDATQRLLGNPRGQASELIRRMRANPFSVVLLDEIEKADSGVFDVFLNVFDEGRQTDTLGRITAFQSSLIVMTSNLGSGSSGTVGYGDPGETIEGKTDPSVVLNFFRPEFFNRIDKVVYFNPLGKREIELIARKELGEIAGREGLVERGIRLTFSEEILVAVTERGFDPVYGARPLQRAVEEAVTLPLGRYLVAHPELRDCTLTANWRESCVGFEVETK